jgi:NAD(P)H-hydrate repair Nnr-like enzyme with NAD(P)H-hydrate dehydratase domain
MTLFVGCHGCILFVVCFVNFTLFVCANGTANNEAARTGGMGDIMTGF